MSHCRYLDATYNRGDRSKLQLIIDFVKKHLEKLASPKKIFYFYKNLL